MESNTIRKYLVQFEQSHWKGRSIDARRGYRNAVDRYAVFLERDPALSDFNADSMQAFDRWLQMQVAKANRKSTIGKLRCGEVRLPMNGLTWPAGINPSSMRCAEILFQRQQPPLRRSTFKSARELHQAIVEYIERCRNRPLDPELSRAYAASGRSYSS